MNHIIGKVGTSKKMKLYKQNFLGGAKVSSLSSEHLIEYIE